MQGARGQPFELIILDAGAGLTGLQISVTRLVGPRRFHGICFNDAGNSGLAIPLAREKVEAAPCYHHVCL